MELNVLWDHLVHLSFHIGQHAEGALGPIPNSLGEAGGIDQVTYLAIAAVRRMFIVTVIVIVTGVTSVDDDVDLRRADATTRHLLERQRVTVETETPDKIGDHV